MNDSTTFPVTKRCTKCGEIKPSDMFHRHKAHTDGLSSQCKKCRRPLSAIEAESFRLSIPTGMKWCGRCGQIKSMDEFYRSSHTKDGLQTKCALCSVATMREWQIANPEKARANSREWARSHPEYTVSRNRIWRERNPNYSSLNSRAWRLANLEYARAREKAWAQAHPEQRKAAMLEWQRANRSKVRATNNAWQRAHPDLRVARKQKRRARLAGVGGRGVTAADIQAMIYCQMGLCAYCERDGQKLTLDHIIPIDQNGPHDPDNCCMCCGVCNSSKGNRTPDEWVDRWYLREK